MRRRVSILSSRSVREYANVDAFGAADQAIERAPAKPGAPVSPDVVPEKDLRDAVATGVVENRLHGVGPVQNIDCGALGPRQADIPFVGDAACGVRFGWFT